MRQTVMDSKYEPNAREKQRRGRRRPRFKWFDKACEEVFNLWIRPILQIDANFDLYDTEHITAIAEIAHNYII